MNILIINQYAGSIDHGMVTRPFYLGREWARQGHNVWIVAGSYSHLRVRTPHVSGRVTEEEVAGISYLWLKTPAYHGKGFLRAVSIAAFIRELYRQKDLIIRECRPDIVITSSGYHLDVMPARAIADRTGAHLIVDVRDLWPLTAIELFDTPRWHPFVLLLQYAEDLAYRCADHAISVLPNAEPHMRAHGLPENSFSYIPNGIDVRGWDNPGAALSDEHQRILRSLRHEGKFILGYAGQHGLAHALDDLMKAAHLLRKERVALVLVGQGPEKAALQSQAERLALTNVFFLPPVARPQIPALLDGMDSFYIGWHRRSLYRFGISPNKLLDYMAAGKPVIHAVDAANDLVAESGGGISVPPEDPAAIAAAISRLAQMPLEEQAVMGEKGKAYVHAHHDYQILAERFLTTIGQLRERSNCRSRLSRSLRRKPTIAPASLTSAHGVHPESADGASPACRAVIGGVE
jgi:glycosyltransferase involved in cell wall biosynthesis